MKTVKVLRFIKRFSLLMVLLAGAAEIADAQKAAKTDRIAILPFNGGSYDERDGIAELFSFTPQIMNNFLVIPRTAISKAAEKEQSFQYSSGMTDADTITKIGNQFGADYVMAGSITSLGRSSLLVVSIIKIDVIQQVAGDFLVYDSLDELNRDDTILKKMSANLVAMMKQKYSKQEKLAVLPVQFSGTSNEQEGDALAQLLSIYLIRSGKYAVYPRTKTLEQVEDEYKIQLSGVTRDSEAVSLGRGINPPYVLSVASRKIGSTNRFNASIIDLEAGYQVAGHTEPYATLIDGMNAMEFLAKELSGIKVSEKERKNRVNFIEDSAKAEETLRKREIDNRKKAEAADRFLKSSGLNFTGKFGFNLSANSASDDSSAKSDWTGGFGVELRLTPYFGVQTGVDFFQGYVLVETANKESFLLDSLDAQIPVFLRGNIWLGDTDAGFNLSPYLGVGFNVYSSVSMSKSDGIIEPQSTPKYCFIAGGELGMSFINFNLFLGIQYNFNFENKVVRINASEVSYKSDSFVMSLGIGYFIPFRKR